MNSPVSCLPDPIQNMPQKRLTNNNRPQKAKTNNKQMMKRQPTRLSDNSRFLSSTPAISAPASYGAVIGARKYFPLTQGMGGSMVVSNFEDTGLTITGSGGYTSGGSVLNPGINGTGGFAWLSTLARNYMKFRWRFLRYIYVPQCASTTPGSVWLTVRYDYFDQGPQTLAEVTATSSSVVGNAWFGSSLSPELAFSRDVTTRDAICLDIDLSKLSQPWYYVRASAGATSNVVALNGTATGGNGTLALGNAQTFETASRPATVWYGGNGITNAIVAGNIYVAYVCEFSDPVLAANQV